MTTRPCSASSRAPTWPAVFTPVIRPGCCGCAGRPPSAGVRIGAQVELPRPGRLRTPVHRRRAPRTSSPTSSTRSVRWHGLASVGGHDGQLRQTPWRPLQHDRDRHGQASACRRRSRTRGQSRSAGARPAWFGVLRRGDSGWACARSRRLSPTGPTCRTAAWCPGRNRVRYCTIRRRSPNRVIGMLQTGRVQAIDGTDIEVHAESVCVHGDSPGATQIATAVQGPVAGRRHRVAGVQLMRLKAGRPDIGRYADKFTVPVGRPRTRRCRRPGSAWPRCCSTTASRR